MCSLPTFRSLTEYQTQRPAWTGGCSNANRIADRRPCLNLSNATKNFKNGGNTRVARQQNKLRQRKRPDVTIACGGGRESEAMVQQWPLFRTNLEKWRGVASCSPLPNRTPQANAF